MKKALSLCLILTLCFLMCACNPARPKVKIILTPENVQDYLWIEPETANYESVPKYIESFDTYVLCDSADCIIHIDKKVPCELSNVKLMLKVYPDGCFLDEEVHQTLEIQIPADGHKTAELHFSDLGQNSESEKFIIEVTDVSGSVEIEK